ncbi:hypothetical protein [Actinacidiphila yeochonensis]|uniref:hypothetical protein n=1 Tax=Actinacidiphila yeochonensis TaxID=89050 RepID=UPI000561338B|nr:hypothetical protein [Actinacidiphila yeochonensis]
MAREAGGIVVGSSGTRCHIDIDEDGWYAWRLTANNGRVIALGVGTYREDTQCRAAFEALCSDAGKLVGGVQHAAEANGWVWRARDAGGRTRAVSARAYERHSTCQAAYDRFRMLLGVLAETGIIPWGDTA